MKEFEPGNRVVVRNTGTVATVVTMETTTDLFTGEEFARLVLIRPDDGEKGRFFVEPNWLWNISDATRDVID